MDSVITLKQKLMKRIPYKDNVFGTSENYNMIIDDLIESSKFIALSKIYPFDDYSNLPLPNKYNNWQYRCCIELFNLADKTGFTNYSEGGYNWSRLSDGISLSLMEEIMPKVGIPKQDNVEV